MYLIRNFGESVRDMRGATTEPINHSARDALDNIAMIHSRIAYGLELKTRLTGRRGVYEPVGKVRLLYRSTACMNGTIEIGLVM
jgi:hypothetical protein